jgi:hypothetical protein
VSLTTMAQEMVQQGYSPDDDITNFYYDPGSTVANAYNSAFGLGSRPRTALIDRDGNVRFWGGAVLNHDAEWQARIEELL